MGEHTQTNNKHMKLSQHINKVSAHESPNLPHPKNKSNSTKAKTYNKIYTQNTSSSDDTCHTPHVYFWKIQHNTNNNSTSGFNDDSHRQNNTKLERPMELFAAYILKSALLPLSLPLLNAAQFLPAPHTNHTRRRERIFRFPLLLIFRSSLDESRVRDFNVSTFEIAS